MSNGIELSCVVIRALMHLTHSLSMGSNHVILSNESDVHRMKDILKRLYDDGQRLDSDLIRQWAAANGRWRPKDIDKLINQLNPIIEGKNVRIKDIYRWDHNLLEEIKRECREINE